MRLEDYFDFLSPDDIRIKGHRIGIKDVIRYYLSGFSPEDILEELPSLNLEKIHAVITFYLGNRSQIDAYMLRLEKSQEQDYQEWLLKEPTEVIARLRSLKAQVGKELLPTS
ncbi:hypothetical protein Syn7502_00262 [Synechococcus sp. PCC 7502]|uniref:DUF433 domain-containing protein n=1 Tax=Synechococcus sp. PCC 7502 TaxID=1173263 RepID=UPI00029FEA61|nr:DUF433 domain-containing protein [Synechococcus sp. PCC 7502]AFY72429.1 hypothetical protein Syn7502_00262 [Synechococcus sp. PCC 7502]